MSSKKVLIYFFLMLAFAVGTMIWLNSRDSLAKYHQNIDNQKYSIIFCQEILTGYEEERLGTFGEDKTFEDWQICLSKANYSYNSLVNIAYYPFLLTVLLSFLIIGKKQINISNRSILLLFLSPLALLFASSFTYQVWLSSNTSKLNPNSLPTFFVVLTFSALFLLIKWIKRLKNHISQNSKQLK